MNAPAHLFLAVVGLPLAIMAETAPRSSADYHVTAEMTAGSGGSSTSANYAQEAVLETVAGVSALALPAGEDSVVKQGYIAQLYDVVALDLVAAPEVVDENSAGQLSAWKRLDDDTFLAVQAETVAWSIQSGPLAAIQPSGGFTTQAVFANAVATARRELEGLTGMVEIQVRDVDDDNFGSYAGDDLPDAWQVQFFGQEHPLAGPGLDADGDGYLNSWEYLAGTHPGDGSSYFRLKVIHPNSETAPSLQWPSLLGRHYEVQTCPSLTEAGWQTVATLPGTGEDITWTHLQADTGGREFYRVIARF